MPNTLLRIGLLAVLGCSSARLPSGGQEGGEASQGTAPTAGSSSACTTAEVKLELGGITCPSCRDQVAAALNGMTGVESATVTFGEADVTYCSDTVTPADMVATIKGLGYEAVIK